MLRSSLVSSFLLPVMRAPMIYCRGFTGRATDPDITLSSPQPSCSTIEHQDPGLLNLYTELWRCLISSVKLVMTQRRSTMRNTMAETCNPIEEDYAYQNDRGRKST